MSKFYKCKCGNVVEELFSASNEKHEGREELIANTVDASVEKHTPVINVTGNMCTVTVGSVEHPMSPEHYIVFVQLVTTFGTKRVDFTPDAKPVALFGLLPGEEVYGAYAYCNLHGLWKTQLK